jgi:apoptosis-inducing factor 3
MTWTGTGLRSDELRENDLRGVVLGERPVVVVRVGGELRAVQGSCPHIGGDLADGSLDEGRITCPLHAATYDLATGAVLADPFGVSPPEGAVEPLPVYPVRVTDGEVEVDL